MPSTKKNYVIKGQEKQKYYFVVMDAQEIMPYEALLRNVQTETFAKVHECAIKNHMNGLNILDKTNIGFAFESTNDRDAFYNEIKDLVKSAKCDEKECYKRPVAESNEPKKVDA